ncbi:DPY30 domain-containing protein 2-like [Ceratina calcarata]|uniref:DPY30 domain-containing protein 2-like n=1 Tax=Ceratina calcarata TaxID=156304 RepID=A0AAJ7WCN1_9HYME|nr:DPY30 domain-containing protein 2-like [Ceratina calcarata]
MGFTIEETEELRRLWNLELEDRFEIDSFASLPSSSNEYLSSDGLFLKNLISKPLTQALREIVAKKPFDPIEYLGHWLLNYKICEEREQRRKEFELELMLEREKLPLWVSAMLIFL